MDLEVYKVTIITYGVCKGFEEVCFTDGSKEWGELMVLLNTEKEIVRYFSEEDSLEEQEQMRAAAEEMIGSGVYRLKTLFMEKEKTKYLYDFHYVFKREELEQRRFLYFEQIPKGYGKYKYIIYQDKEGKGNVTYCFPEFNLQEDYYIISDEHFIEKLEEMGFDLTDIKETKLPF
ncbi:TPA: hypothetical protein ACGW5B_005533 [Bacillus paranthracis]|uniref:hypothetical protein n=1 Tax=Bacillus TaxID=1386 RepID=UPI00027CCB2D|nr:MULTISPECIES: hypothetical protein [unclassified Bacillus cereus group]AFQ13281.1 hypothetical protein BCK_27363 [Bacillus cereus FRI-35]MDX5839899.1 hypothetical protein [Bacillus cereus group sp. BfR-BA-01700]MDX5846236.1 hypothetical protein [Bacillus cereus group sp. BfR-BA-01233]MDX5941850.1 hypothetical protein [Bacillus cereus group sp. BfR-BA-00415]